MEAVHRKDRQAWIDNFAENAVVEDPIGPSPFDPGGKGHAGKEAIGAFWDRNIGPNRILFNLQKSYAAGSEVANVGMITVAMPNGTVMLVEGVFTYRVDEAGKLVSLRAYWEMDNLKVLAPVSAS
jgi:ketosteroid isomerase-like protein